MQSNTVYVNGNRSCSYQRLEAAGAPSPLALISVTSEGKAKAIKDWLGKNWMFNTELMVILNSMVNELSVKPHKTYSVRNSAYMSVMKGVLDFVHEEKDTLRQITSAFEYRDKVVPKLTKNSELAKLSFAERQAILTANREGRLEEVPPDEAPPESALRALMPKH